MKPAAIVIAFSGAMLSACATAPASAAAADAAPLNPVQAVMRAAEAAPQGPMAYSRWKSAAAAAMHPAAFSIPKPTHVRVSDAAQIVVR